jgi:beta-N-acetylhexosaminidase/D-alanyl-D-alanine dipeptidase
VTAPELQPDELVDIHVVDDTIALDIRYATANNFTGVAVYPQARCKLRYAIARRLAAVQAAVRARGYRLEVWDCYRPFSVQKKLWELVPDPRYVAKPVSRRGKLVSGSKHNRGAAVDLTLIDSAGSELEMPTAYDEFSRKAHRNWRGASKRAREHSQLLEQAMVDQGFEPLPTEWWHFDGPGWADYPLSDEPL